MSESKEQTIEAWRGQLGNQRWRLQNLYWIENKAGGIQRFAMNAAQRRLHDHLWFRNDILKARQLGISTYAALLMLDMSLFRPNFHSGIIDKSLPDAQQKLSKIRFAWEHLDYEPHGCSDQDKILAQMGAFIKERTGVRKTAGLKLKTDARTELAFANGSDVRIGTNLRGGTLQFLHVSELAHVSVHAPWRAREIRTGAINTVSSTGYILKESTHEGGRYGVNYELTHQAMENNAKEELSSLDFKFFFFSWFDHDDYTLSGHGRLSAEMERYFAELELKHGIKLDAGRKRWYAHMARLMGGCMRQEYPSTPQEAFYSGEEGSIYGGRIMELREKGHLGLSFIAIPDAPIFTSWDLGLSDHTAIWLVQLVGTNLYWLDHYACNQKGLEHYVAKMREWESIHGAIDWHLLPHDAARRDAYGQSYVEHLAREGVSNVRVVPRTSDVWIGINALRRLLDASFFHERTLCRVVNARGDSEPGALEHLELYHSQPPGTSGSLREEPVHDEHSHTADAARTLAEAYQHGLLQKMVSTNKPRRQARMS
ncbi:MAG: hypothetical protein RR373_06255 [Akkermansia sp.]